MRKLSKIIIKISRGFRIATVSLAILSVFIFTKLSFAAPGMKVTAPDNASIVHPGQEITVTIAAVEGFSVQEAFANVSGSSHYERITALPITFNDKIPLDAAGQVAVSVVGRDVSDNPAIDFITLKVEQAAVLQYLEVEPKEFLIDVDWNGNIKGNYHPYISVGGNYSDGVIRAIQNFGTTYTSSDPSVVSVDSQGKIQVNKIGAAVITISNSGISANIPVIFKEPYGARPKDTVSPVTTLNIQPPANARGWHNSNIAVSLNATDNEGGSGVRQIIYTLNGSEPIFVSGNTAQIIVADEGINKLQNQASDNDGNYEDVHVAELKIDKTPPATTATVTPLPDAQGCIRSLPVKVTFSATDNLSGIAFTTPEKTITTPGTYQVEYYSQDVAGNTENVKTMTLNIVAQDTTAPKISLQLKPVTIKIGRITLIVPHLYTFVYSATDNESGVKELKTGVIVPDVSKFKTNLIKSGRLHITINEKKKSITIRAPNPEEVLSSLNKEGMLLIQNNRPLFLQELPRSDEWTITELGGSMIILAPKIVFEAKAVDNANNAAVEKLEYEEHR